MRFGTSELLNKVRQRREEFKGREQQDAHELLVAVLNTIDEDQKGGGSDAIKRDAAGAQNNEAADTAALFAFGARQVLGRSGENQRRDSDDEDGSTAAMLRALIQGSLTSKVTRGSNVSTTVSHCWSLQLPIPGAERARHARSGGGKQAKKRAKQNRKRERQLQLQRGPEPEPEPEPELEPGPEPEPEKNSSTEKDSIVSMLEHFCVAEQIGDGDAVKELKLSGLLPPVLILHLVRFHSDGHTIVKYNGEVMFTECARLLAACPRTHPLNRCACSARHGAVHRGA